MSEDEDLFGEFRTFVLDQVLHVCASKRDEYVELKQFDRLDELRRQFGHAKHFDKVAAVAFAVAPTKHFAKVPTNHFAKVPTKRFDKVPTNSYTKHLEQIDQDTLIIHYK